MSDNDIQPQFDEQTEVDRINGSLTRYWEPIDLVLVGFLTGWAAAAVFYNRTDVLTIVGVVAVLAVFSLAMTAFSGRDQ